MKFTEFLRLNESEDKVQPKTTKELKRIINMTTYEKGLDCDLNFIDTSKITDMTELFRESKFKGDISKWDVSNVKDMYGMFQESKFDGDISKWDVSKVKNMDSMFYKSEFNGDISKWDVSSVITMEGMFKGSEFKGDISNGMFLMLKVWLAYSKILHLKAMNLIGINIINSRNTSELLLT